MSSPEDALPLLKAAVAYVDAGANCGTAYLVELDRAVTCEHVVRSVPRDGSVTLYFPDNIIRKALVERRDTSIDSAVLKLSEPISTIRPLPFASSVPRQGEFQAFGFPAATGRSGLPLIGRILDPHGEDTKRMASIVLFSDMASAGQGARLQGFSGSPVWANGGVVGHLKRIIADKEDPERSELGVLYASDLRDIQALLGTSPGSGEPKSLQPPNCAYDSDWYVGRGPQEKEAIAHLLNPGMPAVLYAPELFGKTWLLKHLLSNLPQQLKSPVDVCMIYPDLIDSEAWASFDQLTREIGRQVIDTVGGKEEWISEAWNGKRGPRTSLGWLMEHKILKGRDKPLILAIDRADTVFRHEQLRDEFFSTLRGWASLGDERGYGNLRLLLTISTTPTLLNQDLRESPFNITEPIELKDLKETQIQELANRYGLGWGSAHFKALMGLVGGHPYLVRLLMYTASHEGRDLSDLLKDATGELFDPYLNRCRTRISKRPELFLALKQIADKGGAGIDFNHYSKLYKAGFVNKAPSGEYQLRYKLYERLLR